MPADSSLERGYHGATIRSDHFTGSNVNWWAFDSSTDFVLKGSVNVVPSYQAFH